MATDKAKGNSVRVKPRMAPPLPKTPAGKPTMRSNAKDIVNKASAKANARGLKAANTASTSKSAPAARSAAQKRATLVVPSKRTAAQKMAVKGGMKPVPNRGGGRMRISGGAGGLRIDDMNR